MSVIVWDGKTLAADTLGTNEGLKRQMSKTMKWFDNNAMHTPVYLAWTGQQDHGGALWRWYLDGQKPAEYPDFQKTADWTRLIVVMMVEKQWILFAYEQTPYPMTMSAPCAFGSGRDFAMGAMAMGADARKAVEIACKFSTGCGLPVEAYDVM